MTASVGANTGTAPLARQINGQQAQLAALNTQQTQYVLDASGDCVAVIGDISKVPQGDYTSTPTMVATGLTGFGIASKKTGSWVQL